MNTIVILLALIAIAGVGIAVWQWKEREAALAARQPRGQGLSRILGSVAQGYAATLTGGTSMLGGIAQRGQA